MIPSWNPLPTKKEPALLVALAPFAPLSIINASTTPFESLYRSEINSDLKDYLDSFTDSKESFTEAFERLSIDASKYLCVCSITLKIPNKPVKLNDAIFDYQSLIDLPMKQDGSRIHPTSGLSFHLNQIEPANNIKALIQQIIGDKEALAKTELSL